MCVYHGGKDRVNKGSAVLVDQSCPTLCNAVDYSPPGSSVKGILQARILEWVAIPFSRGLNPGLLHLHRQVSSLPLAPPVSK